MSFFTQIYNFISSSLELDHNEEFFSEVETEWQIESGNFEENENLEILQKSESQAKMKETLDQAARIMPEMSTKSHILSDDQVKLEKIGKLFFFEISVVIVNVTGWLCQIDIISFLVYFCCHFRHNCMSMSVMTCQCQYYCQCQELH